MRCFLFNTIMVTGTKIILEAIKQVAESGAAIGEPDDPEDRECRAMDSMLLIEIKGLLERMDAFEGLTYGDEP